VGNDDRISFAASLSTEFSGTSVNAMVASLREDSQVEGKAQETIGASFGVSMANGLGISGAWARGDNHGSKAAVAASKMEGCFDSSTGAKTMPVVIAKDRTETTAGATGCETGSQPGTYMDDESDAMTGSDPSYFQAGIAYSFGDTTVSASWWNTEDFVTEGSDGTALGVGVNHNMPKVGAQVYAAVQGYSTEKMAGMKSEDETVAVVGTRVRF